MTWLSQQDRDDMEAIKAAGRFSRAQANGSFVKISVRVAMEYPKVPYDIKLDLPRPMRDSEALEYAASIGHPKSRVRGFYTASGSFFSNED